MITDRMRFSVLQVNTDHILARDLVVRDPQVAVNLSAPCHMSFKLDQGQQYESAYGIHWKNWGQWVICEMEFDYQREIWAYGLVTDNKVDPQTGDMTIEVTGPIGYPKTIPWLENYNPIACDPFEVVQRIWAHLQSYSNSQLNIEVLPASSGTQMLPGYAFDGNILAFDFFAMFIRAVDMVDAGDTISGLARDIPFDMFEEAWWTEEGELWRQIRMAYPQGGLQQTSLSFRVGDNIFAAEHATEADIEPVSDVIIRGWLPGKVYSSQLSNHDDTRARRVIMEEAAYVDSTERAAAWARRKLTRRNVPPHFSKIYIDPNHPNAPLGSFHVGDTIRVQAPLFPWHGEIDEWHRILSITYNETSTGAGQQTGAGIPPGMVQLDLKVEGAFNFDPIYYDENYEQQPTEDPNRLHNGYFADNLAGWTASGNYWIRVATSTFDDVYNPDAGCVRCDPDVRYGAVSFTSSKAWVEPGETITLECACKWQDIVSGDNDAFQLIALPFGGYGAGGTPFVVDEYVNPEGTHGWILFKIDDWVVPEGVTAVSLRFHMTAGVDGGVSWWTYARVYATPAEEPDYP